MNPNTVAMAMPMRDLIADREDRNRKRETRFIGIEVEAAKVKAPALGKLPRFLGFETFFGPGWMQPISLPGGEFPAEIAEAVDGLLEQAGVGRLHAKAHPDQFGAGQRGGSLMPDLHGGPAGI